MKYFHIAVICFVALYAADSVAQDSRSIDDQLLDNLEKELDLDPIDPFDREATDQERSRSNQGATRNPDVPPDLLDDQFRNRLRQELGHAATDEEGAPLLEVARQMRRVESLISQNDAGRRTQQMQGRIIDDLDALIEQARKKCKSQGKSPKTGEGKKPGSGEPSNKPIEKSNAKPGKGDAKSVDMGQVEDVVKEIWGTLPQRERDHMLQLPFGEFLPDYETLIESYFRSLLEPE